MRRKKDSEGDKNKKMDGREEKKKKRQIQQQQKKKSKIVFHYGVRENRPLTPTKKDPRALWTTGTSGKALFDKPLNTFALI